MTRLGKRIISGVGMIVVLAFSTLAFSRLGDTEKYSEYTGYLMDTVVTVKIYAPRVVDGNAVIARAFDEAARLEHILVARNGGGELDKINKGESGRWWIVSPELRTVLERAKHFYEVTGGAFDPTVARVKWLWNFDEGGSIPETGEFEKALGMVGYDRVILSSDSLNLGTSGAALDLGGIGKGYIVDRMVDILRDAGVDAGLVNAGGDMYSFGVKQGGMDWVIGLRHPRRDEPIVMQHFDLPSVATSGDYERYFTVDGVQYHHILDPATGYPARGCTSVTVWTTSAMDADVLATSLFVLGPEKGIQLAEELDDVEALIFFDTDNGLAYRMTSGVQDKMDL